ncbi:MAG: bifunctional riboflavin kinase/FAD synthetase [Gemmatimonadota bacterium]
MRSEGGAVVTVGAFDGIHVGHRALIAATVEEARRRRLPAVVVTFATHPAAVLRPERAPALLTTREEKLEAIASLGADRVVFVPFSRAVADLTAREFVSHVLVDRLDTRHLIIGHDHALGRDRVGDAAMLRELGAELGFDVTVVEPVRASGGRVSSSRIREALAAGEVRAAQTLLGRPYWLTGEVVRGEGRGRELGVPTANMGIDAGKLLPAAGIYAVRVWDGGPHDGVLHVGPRPVFDDARTSVEVHLLGFSGDLYGRRLRLELIDRVRGVRDFDSVDDLVAAMHQDVLDAKAALERASLVREGPPAEY